MRSLLGRSTYVESEHHQAIRRLGRTVKATATSPDGMVESIERTDRRFALGLQWHPERDPGGPGDRVAEAFVAAAAPRAGMSRRPMAAPVAADAAVTLRFASFADARDLLRLAQLDSAEPLREPILVGEASGRVTAALSLADARVIVDPFVLSMGVVELLRARARQLSAADRRWGRRRRFLRLRALLRANPL